MRRKHLHQQRRRGEGERARDQVGGVEVQELRLRRVGCPHGRGQGGGGGGGVAAGGTGGGGACRGFLAGEAMVLCLGCCVGMWIFLIQRLFNAFF